MIINTERFQLRTLTTKDATDKYLSWFNESLKFSKYISFAQKKVNIGDLIQYIENRENREDVLFLAIFTDDSQHIGNIKYEPINFENRSATMGILIGEKEWRGKGVASEVIKRSSEYLKENFGIKNINLGVDKNNIPAITAYKKMQFKVVKEVNNRLKMRLSLK
jgi:[ribosomal protein S5]-alanine N-acetyltransferase